MKEQTISYHREEVTYDDAHWERLSQLRTEAARVMEHLAEFSPVAYGSVARGDIHLGSDIDIFLPLPVSSYLVELALGHFGIHEKVIAMATPWHLIKAHIVLSSGVTVTFPLVDFRGYEKEFYYFGGAVSLGDLAAGRRVPGVDKRLMLIEPTPTGHRGSEVTGREAEVAKIVNVPLGMVRERQQVLHRRNKVGRTGIYLHQALPPDANIELELKRLADTDTNVKRRYR